MPEQVLDVRPARSEAERSARAFELFGLAENTTVIHWGWDYVVFGVPKTPNFFDRMALGFTRFMTEGVKAAMYQAHAFSNSPINKTWR